MKTIPSFKPAISYKQLNKALLRLLLFSNFSSKIISTFEEEFARYLDVKHAIRVPSGRWGLYYILQNLNLKEGDEVILPAFTYFAVPAVIVKLGLSPIFVDIGHQSLNMDIQSIKENITDKTRVIILTHLCGFTCAVEEILEVSQKHNVIVIEDCAQSLGAEYKNKKVGSYGEAAYFTFSLTKNFTTLGGGLVVTSNDALASRIQNKIMMMRQTPRAVLLFKLLKAYIMQFATSSALFPIVYAIMRIFYSFGIDIVNCIFREKKLLFGKLPRSNLLNNVQAELGIMQLNNLDRENEIRIKKGLELYGSLGNANNIRIPILEKNAKNIFSSCPIFVQDKKKMKKILLTKGIDTSLGYMEDCSNLEMFNGFKKNCPNASRAEEEILYLPLYTGLDSHTLRYIEGVIKDI